MIEMVRLLTPMRLKDRGESAYTEQLSDCCTYAHRNYKTKSKNDTRVVDIKANHNSCKKEKAKVTTLIPFYGAYL
jgi:hypothetical protein